MRSGQGTASERYSCIHCELLTYKYVSKDFNTGVCSVLRGSSALELCVVWMYRE